MQALKSHRQTEIPKFVTKRGDYHLPSRRAFGGEL
jgi:hypothetical protein